MLWTLLSASSLMLTQGDEAAIYDDQSLLQVTGLREAAPKQLKQEGTALEQTMPSIDQSSTAVRDVIVAFCNSWNAGTSPEVYAEVDSSWASSVDCSQNPLNTEVGYNLTGVTFAQCAAEDDRAGQMFTNASDAYGGIYDWNCFETVVDEGTRKATVWMELSIPSKFKVRSASLLTVDANDKISGIHSVVDTFNLLGGDESDFEDSDDDDDTPVAVPQRATANPTNMSDAVTNYCSSLGATGVSLTQRLADCAPWFAALVNCSSVPYNPVVGYDLANVDFAECVEKEEYAMQVFERTSTYQQGGHFTASCKGTTIDEEKRIASIWTELSDGQVGMMKAERFHFDDDFRITARHVVFDTYNFLQGQTDGN